MAEVNGKKRRAILKLGALATLLAGGAALVRVLVSGGLLVFLSLLPALVKRLGVRLPQPRGEPRPPALR